MSSRNGTEENEERKRRHISIETKVLVLTEAGYRCAVPTCRSILALDLHHLVALRDDGGDAPSNLIALCPTCHALYHKGIVKPESLALWKAMLVTLTNAFDKESVDNLLFLHCIQRVEPPIISGDTVFRYSKLVSAGLVTFKPRYRRSVSVGAGVFASMAEGELLGYVLALTDKGKLVVEAWEKGDRESLKAALGVVGQGAD